MMKYLRALRRDRRGVTSVEVMFAMPVLIIIVGFTMDLGLLLVRNVMLERAVDVSVRDIRLDLADPTDYPAMRKAICEEARILPDCESRLKMQLNAMSPYDWEDPGRLPDCESLDRVTVTEPRDYDVALRNELVFFRACVVLEPVLPTWSLGDRLLARPDGQRNRFYQATASTTYTKE